MHLKDFAPATAAQKTAATKAAPANAADIAKAVFPSAAGEGPLDYKRLLAAFADYNGAGIRSTHSLRHQALSRTSAHRMRQTARVALNHAEPAIMYRENPYLWAKRKNATSPPPIAPKLFVRPLRTQRPSLPQNP
ncbi:hypothetical protein [Geminisphaera colitermitum]|uniref:hypothetical protein n=1 Tax=Geminisphaera colitermitum TaxID=1148786 RepID=UPI0001964D99|nr:hypothetical protein [Geminisphaera colitermitum]